LIGKRPGDVFKCAHAREHGRGCGFSLSCPSCTALKLFIRALETSSEITDAAELLIEKGEQRVFRNLEIKVTPFDVETERLFIISVVDNTNKNLLNDLEHTFFHDVVNKVSALRGYMKLIHQENQMLNVDEYTFLEVVLNDLIDIINMQRKLIDLNGGKKALHVEEISVQALFKYLEHFFGLVDDKYAGRLIRHTEFEEVQFSSDEVLIKRVLINIVKNALEESSRGERVEFGVKHLNSDFFEIHVHNKKQIPNEILEKLFFEVVSTKNGSYHGWGTKSMKLIGETYLKGTIDIHTDQSSGTTVSVKLPYRLEVSE
jgi:signal transduction histidine kinase